ncbi:unnamed protein product [Brachionus calyciflorus]|uniref:Uncharacterized protein n=1 Tax=Brachionus calyciflorus TaxID=104777 RepID=A0A814QUU6_9BILA|nr:unnamed protein product [Brachionus calyciflorus]
MDIFEAFKREIEEKLKKQKEDFDNLPEEVKLISASADAKLFWEGYNGTDLIKEVSGHPAHIWAANCRKILFNKDEC